MSADEVLVVFTPSGKRGYFTKGTPVLQAARQLGVDIDSVCGGRGICGRCKVTVGEGEFAKHGITSSADSLSPLSEPEQRFAKKKTLNNGSRLSCHTQLQKDSVIDVPASSQVHKQVVRKPFEAHDIQINPIIHLYLVDVAPASLDDGFGDLQRLYQALDKEWGLKNLSAELSVQQQLQQTLRKQNWQVTVAVRDDKKIVAIWPGFKEAVYGVAVDIGSTTIAASLCNLADGEVIASSGMMNPQIRFGEDLMSRVSYAMMNDNGDQEMTAAVRQALNELLQQMAEQAEINNDDILEIVLVGNPVMHHLLLGINPTQLGISPFALATDEATSLKASELDLSINSNAQAYVLPCIAGHVGADAAAVMLAEEPYKKDEVTLIVDVGTNAEIILGNKKRLLAASSPTGPAFEGAQISAGQRAAAGAIERVRINPKTFQPTFKVIGCELWSDDPEFDQPVTGICGSGIIEAIAEMYLVGLINQDGVINGDLGNQTNRVQAEGRTFCYHLHQGEPNIVITQHDVRAIQLAKAALYAGVKVLMSRMQVKRVDRIRLAGAFGSHIDVKYAMVLGLIPDCQLDKVSSAGNAAGTGARIALLDKSSRLQIEQQVRAVEKIETATAEDFESYFVNAMAFPNKEDRFLELEKVISLPQAFEIKIEEKAGKRRRRKRKPAEENII